MQDDAIDKFRALLCVGKRTIEFFSLCCIFVSNPDWWIPNPPQGFPRTSQGSPPHPEMPGGDLGGGLSEQSGQNQWKGCQKLRSRYLLADLPDLADLADLPEVVSASAPQNLPSTRAGGQDDVS